MSFAKKLKQVVAANFIEIARSDEDTRPAAEPEPPTSAAAAPAAEPEVLPLDNAQPQAPSVNGFHEQAISEAARAVARYADDSPAETEVYDDDPTAPLADFVADEGDVDFDRVYRRHRIPPTKFTAEQALTMLSTMPRDLSLRVKRLTVKATLDAIGGTIGATPETISEDARAKRESLERFVADLDAETADARVRIDEEIESLKQQIESLKQVALASTRKRNAAEEMCRAKAETLDQIIAFFEADDHSEEGIDPSASAPAAEVDELPPFMREDAVLRLLGITPEENEMGLAEAQAAGRKGGIRRRHMSRRTS